MAKSATKKTPRKKASKAKAKAAPAPNPMPAADALSEIAARAEGGKVAVVERGKKAKIVKGPGAAAAPEPIPLSEDAKEAFNEVLRRANNIDSQIAQNRARFMAAEKQLLEQRDDTQREVESTIKMMGRRFKVPDGWVLNLEDMTFVPRPGRPGLGGPFPRPA
jgi:hypothetical protein